MNASELMAGFRIVIPARLQSTRLPGKLLLDLEGKSILQRTWDAACSSNAKEVIIASDSEEITHHAQKFGADVVVTDAEHVSGTDRVAQVAKIRQWDDTQIVVNCQADEPFIPPSLLNQLSGGLTSNIRMVTAAVKEYNPQDSSSVKVIIDKHQRALYFSRAEVPFDRDANGLNQQMAWRHIGVYCWDVRTLLELCQLPVSPLESSEKLEQLRALENSIPINVIKLMSSFQAGIDTHEDLVRCRKYLELIK